MAEEHQIELTPVIKAGDVIHSAKRLQSVIKEALDASAGRELNSQLIGIKGNIEKINLKTEATVQAIEKEKAEFERLGQEMDKQEGRVARANSELRKQEAILNKMVKEQAERSPDSYSYEKAQAEIDAQQKVVEVTSKRLEMERKERDRIDAQQMKSEENLLKLTNQQEQLNNQTRIYGEKWNYVVAQQDEAGESAGVAQQRKDMMNLNKGIMGVTTSVRSLGMLIPGVSTKGFRAVSMLTRSMVRLSSLTKDELTAGFGVLKKTALNALNAIAAHPIVALVLAAITAITYALKKLYDETKKEVEALGKLIKKGLESAIKLFKKFVVTISKTFVGLGLLVSKSILNALARIGQKLLSLKSVIAENLKLMAKWRDGNNAINRALSNLMSSLAYLKGSLAAAFAPILTTIEPILTRLIDKLAEAINMIGMFIAKLSGASTFQKAIRVQKDYAKALDKTGSAAKKALAPFDELNVLASQQGGGAGNEAVDWEEITLKDFELPEWLKDLYELGRTVGTNIRDFLNDIPWDSVKEGAKKAAQGIADFINGILSVKDLGKSVGHFIGELLNTFTAFVNTLLTEIHFGDLGKQLGETFQEAIETINWDELGELLKNAWNSLFEMLYNFFTSFSGTDLGQALTEMFQNALGGIDWILIRGTIVEAVHRLVEMLRELITPENFALLGKTLAEALNTIVKAVGTFVEDMNAIGDDGKTGWQQFGESIMTGIATMFQNFNAADAGEALSGLAMGLLDMLLAAVDYLNDHIDEVSDKFVEFISNIDWSGLASKATEISEKLREALQDIWTELSNSDAFDDIINLIVDFLKEKKNWEKAFKRIKSEVIREVIWEKVKEGFNNLFRIDEATELFDSANEFFSQFFEDLKNGDWLGALGDLIAGIGETLLGGLELMFGPVITFFETSLNSIADTLGINLKGIKDTVLDIFRGIKNGIKNPINTTIGFIEGFVNKIIDGINWLATKLNSFSFSIPDWVPEWGGKSFSLNLSKLAPVQIPRLAQGAVIPPNKEFIAMLGDQTSGTNIEAPLDTIKQAVAEVLGEISTNGSQPINIYLGTEKIYSELRKLEKRNILMGG